MIVNISTKSVSYRLLPPALKQNPDG